MANLNIVQEAAAGAAKKAGFSLYFGDTIVRVCNTCGATAEYSSVATVDFSHDCPMAFTPGFVPVGPDRFSFAHRGVSVDLMLIDGEWIVNRSGYGYCTTISADTTAADMRTQLIALIEDSSPAYMLLPVSRTALDWISACQEYHRTAPNSLQRRIERRRCR